MAAGKATGKGRDRQAMGEKAWDSYGIATVRAAKRGDDQDKEEPPSKKRRLA